MSWCTINHPRSVLVPVFEILFERYQPPGKLIDLFLGKG